MSAKDSKRIPAIRKCLGDLALLVRVAPHGKNPTDKAWQRIGVERMNDPVYLATLDNHGCNVGVALGAQSSGLCTCDIDDNDEIAKFLDCNPGLAETLRTTRVRGANFWLQIEGDYPASGTIRNKDGKAIGEWRSTGNQTVISGAAIDRRKGETEPTKYRVISKTMVPAKLPFAALTWPADWKLPWNEPERPKRQEGERKLDKPDKATVRAMLAVIPKPLPYDEWLRIIAGVGDALDDADAEEVLNEWDAEDERGQYAYKLRHRLKDVTIGSLIRVAREHGWTSGEKDKEPRKSVPTQLVEMAERFEYFHDTQQRAFVRVPRNEHVEVWPVASKAFRMLLTNEFFQAKRQTVRRDALSEAIAQLEGRALFDAPEAPVFLRVAPSDDSILIDLCDPDWRVVQVTKNGWEVLDSSPVAFFRTRAMRPLPQPVHGGSIAALWELLNVNESQRPLVAGALLNYFHPVGPYFVTNLVGEQGTAKSSGARILRQLVDPSETPLRSPPKEERDLLSQAVSNWCVALDNLSRLPDWLSDALCRLSTGGGHSARELFTDLDEVSIAVKRPVILNGIEDVAARPDLAERALQIELDTIPDNERITEASLWRKFDAARPGIIGAIMDGLSHALRESPGVEIDTLPRMADPAIWATAGEAVFGWPRNTFLRAYSANIAEGAVASVESHPVGVMILKLLGSGSSEWSGTAQELLAALQEKADDETRKSEEWPKNSRALGHALRRLAQALRRAGIGFNRKRSDSRNITLRRKAGKTSTTTSTSTVPDVPDVPDVVIPPMSRDESSDETGTNGTVEADGKDWVEV